MKNLFPLLIFTATALTLNSCASISDTSDDDVYVVKSSQIPVGESLDDETNYGAFKYKKDRDNNNIRYSTNGDINNFNPFFMTGMGLSANFSGYRRRMYNPYYASSYPSYNNMMWVYTPGFGWTVLNPIYNNPFYSGYGNYYGNSFFNGGYYSNYYGNPHFGNSYYGNSNCWNCNNGWTNNNNGNNWNNNNNNGGGSGSSNPYHHSGPRGSSGGGGVVTRSNIPGTLKNTSSSLSSSNSSGSGTVVKPVGKETVMSRSNPARQTDISTRTNENPDFSRPGRTQGGISNSSRGSSSVGSSSRGNGGFTGINNGSGSSTSPRNSGGISSPSNRNSGSGTVGTSSGSEGRGGNSSGGGSTSRPSSGSSGGGRR